MSGVKHSPIPLFDTLEQLHVTAKQLDTGTQITHLDDYHYARQFLYMYRGSVATFNVYRRELERLLQWAWFVAEKSLKVLLRQDIETYVEFCQKPPLTWIGLKNVGRYLLKVDQRVPNPDWRPFVASVSKSAHGQGLYANPKKYVLSQKGVQAVFAVLSSFYNYLIQENYVTFNPVAQIRQKSKYLRTQQNHTVIRRLTELQWLYVIDTAENLAATQPARHERTLFIMNALYGMYLRISELAASSRWSPQMGHFYKDHDANWWFRTVGKGNKERSIAVSDAMLAALKRYRVSLGLTKLPYSAETTPLLLREKGSGPISSTRQLRTIVQFCFDAAAAKLQRENFAEEAEQLRAATVHWLRHTGISDDVKVRPREHVRDDAGHGSSAITDKYIDVELRARHASGKRKIINPS